MAEYGNGELCELSSDDENASSSLIPRQKHRQGACNRAPEPVNQPLNPPPSYRATAVEDRPLSATEKTVARPGPAPEGRKGDRVCVRAPDGPRGRVNPQPLQPRLIGNSQLPPPQYPQLLPPPRGNVNNVNIVAQQPVEVQQPQQQIQGNLGLKTSKKFDIKTVGDNQYYISILLCIVLTLAWNPFALICCIPAFYFGSKAANENKDNNYARALRHQRKAKNLNMAGFICIIVSVFLFFTFMPVLVVVAVVVPVVLVSAGPSNY